MLDEMLKKVYQTDFVSAMENRISWGLQQMYIAI